MRAFARHSFDSCKNVLRMDRLLAMHAFTAVADTQGFARAARELKLSPSAVTRLVATLEDQLGVKLLERTTRSVALTPAGARYLDRARAVLAGVTEAESAARAAATEPFGRFVVTAPTVFGRREVAPLFSEFLATHARVSGELMLSDRVASLVEEGIDLAVRIGELDDSTLRARLVGATRRVLVASPRYLAGLARPRKPEDLAGHATIHLTGLGPPNAWRFPAGRKRLARTVTITPSFVTNAPDVAVAHAARGLGIAMVLAYQAADLVRSGALEILLPDHEPRPLPIHLVVPGGRFVSANARAFIDLTIATRRWDYVELETRKRTPRARPHS